MNHFKHPKTAAIFGLFSRNPTGSNAQTSAKPKPVNQGNLSSGRFDDDVEDARDNTVKGIRYAQTLSGMLTERDPELLRRYILDARTEAEQTCRQIALFKCASIAIACLPKDNKLGQLPAATSQFTSPRRVGAGTAATATVDTTGVVSCCLFAAPVVVTFSNPKQIFKRLPLDHSIQAHVARALEQELAQLSATPLQYVRVEALVAINDLCGITPLQVQTAVSNESRRMNGDFKPSAVFIPQDIQSKALDSYRKHQSGWSMKLSQLEEVWTEIGPDQPVAFLLVGYFGWDRSLPEPAFTDGAEPAKFKLQSLLEGYLSRDRCSGDGEIGANASAERVRVVVDKPMFMHDALTRAQVLQFQVMAQKAKRANCEFDLKREQRATIQHWTARILPPPSQPQPRVHFDQRALTFVRSSANADHFDEPPRVVIEQIYEGFWRPQRHVIDIEQQVLPEIHGFRGAFNAEGDSAPDPRQGRLYFDLPFDEDADEDCRDGGDGDPANEDPSDKGSDDKAPKGPHLH